ncbi:DUF4097 family beta strand repeat-containing protein [Brevibacterium sp. W7.2]|uniref:DUF4097 family beta strand repeat-containing protein n=1 Tax=Brevibacterium sp. W7.2 TaxID=2823518 RepID=UPI001BAA6831|nr:DUF4097 family beta strand repeat-containing protein [Brevibacterium sp. W7.2]
MDAMTQYTTMTRPAITVDIPAGALLVTAGERDGVDVTIEPTNPDRAVDREAAERISVTEGEGTLGIVGEKRLLLGGKGSADVRLEVPTGTDLDVAIGAGSIRLRNHVGAVRVKASAGDVTGDTMVSLTAKVSAGSLAVDEVTDRVDVRLSSGDAQLGRIGGEAHIRSAHGSIRVGEFAGTGELATATGTISLDSVDGDVRAASGHGSVRVRRAGSGRLDLESSFGTIEVGVAAGAPVWIDADSKNGVVRTDLETDSGPLGDELPVEVHAHTKFGDIIIDRAQ